MDHQGRADRFLITRTIMGISRYQQWKERLSLEEAGSWFWDGVADLLMLHCLRWLGQSGSHGGPSNAKTATVR